MGSMPMHCVMLSSIPVFSPPEDNILRSRGNQKCFQALLRILQLRASALEDVSSAHGNSFTWWFKNEMRCVCISGPSIHPS